MRSLIDGHIVYLPHPDEGVKIVPSAFVEIEATFAAEEARRKEKEKRQLKLARRCGFLHGFLNGFSFNIYPVNGHYSWCPLHASHATYFKPLEFVVLPLGEYKKFRTQSDFKTEL